MNQRLEMNQRMRSYNKLEKHVRRWLKDYDGGAEVALGNLFYPGGGGCQSGVVCHLVYYKDTMKFYRRYKAEINALLTELIDSTGLPIHSLFGEKWDMEDPLANETHNQNLLAWFGFEETAIQVGRDLEVEV